MNIPPISGLDDASQARVALYQSGRLVHAPGDNIGLLPISSDASPTFAALTLSGGQIAFPATQNPSSNPNTLDDYEYGSSTPTVTASSGTFTTVSATLDYVKVGDVVHFTMTITITNAGTASGTLRATLPFTPAATSIANGRENTATGFQLQGIMPSGSALCSIFKYDNTGIIGSGRSVIMSGAIFV